MTVSTDAPTKQLEKKNTFNCKSFFQIQVKSQRKGSWGTLYGCFLWLQYEGKGNCHSFLSNKALIQCYVSQCEGCHWFRYCMTKSFIINKTKRMLGGDAQRQKVLVKAQLLNGLLTGVSWKMVIGHFSLLVSDTCPKFCRGPWLLMHITYM